MSSSLKRLKEAKLRDSKIADQSRSVGIRSGATPREQVYAADLDSDNLHFDLLAVLVTVILFLIFLAIKGVIVAEIWNYLVPKLLSNKQDVQPIGFFAG